MVDWSASMQQSYEFYEVDPDTWTDKQRLNIVTKCSISRDAEQETLGSATFDITDLINECYIRVYLITIQNGIKEKHPLGVFLCQTPSSNHDGMVRSVSVDAYTPLIELKENQPPIGYYVAKDTDVMETAHDILNENMRAPVGDVITPSTKLNDNFVSSSDDSWLSFVRDLISVSTYPKYYKVIVDSGEYHRLAQEIEYPYEYKDKVSVVENAKTTNDDIVYTYTDNSGSTNYFTAVSSGIVKYRLELDEMGRVIFAPDQDVDRLTPAWTYTDDNSSILHAEVSMSHDLYGIPNVVRVIWNSVNSDGKIVNMESVVTNDDPDSPTSTVARGRRIEYRVSNPNIHGDPTKELLDEYAEQLLSALSSVEYSISYTHGYCPVRLFDCVRFNYTRAGLTDIKAKVISQQINCETGCTVSEKAVFTKKLWR